MIDETIIHRGNAARELLNLEFFREVLRGMQDETYKAFLSSLPDQSKQREELYYLNLALSYLVDRLEAMASSGRRTCPAG